MHENYDTVLDKNARKEEICEQGCALISVINYDNISVYSATIACQNNFEKGAASIPETRVSRGCLVLGAPKAKISVGRM